MGEAVRSKAELKGANEMNLEIIYEDCDLIAVRKPRGIVSESTERGDGLPDLVSASLSEQRDLYPIYRLDRPVEGVFLLAKNRYSAGKLTVSVEEHRLGKEYLAVVRGRPAESSGEMYDLLYHDPGKNKSYVVRRMRRGVREAELSYELLASADDSRGELSLVRVRLGTGRTHQIRVQFASRRMPILGDDRYGGERLPDGGLALICHRLTVTHPRDGRLLTLQCAPPPCKPWSIFGAEGSVGNAKAESRDPN